jgi:PAS domain S-box-containing protein
MKVPLCVLLVEDSEADAMLVTRALQRDGYDLTFERVETAKAMSVALDRSGWDIVIADYSMPHFSGLDALELLKYKGIDLPFIIVSGTIGEEVAVEVMRSGAHDYVMKENLARLGPAIRRELRDAQERRARRQAEDQLRLLSWVVEQSSIMVTITNTEGQIEYINPSFTRITGYTPEEVIGKNPRILKSGETPPEEYEQLWETVMNGGEWRGEFHNKKKNGNLYWELATISPIRDPAGNSMTHLVKVAEDITALKQLESLKSEFIRNVSHELRTPLALIRGYAEVLDDGGLGEVQPDQREPVAVIARRAKILSRMVDDFAVFLETGTPESRCEPVDLGSLVHNQISSFQATVEQAGLTIETHVASDLPAVAGDESHLSRVLGHLLDNACKFTPAGGHISVRLEQEGDELVLEVSDNGIGISDQQFELIFDIAQGDGSMSRRYGGIGLGLALVKKVVEAHGGRVDVESQVKKGSVFRVSLPPSDASRIFPDITQSESLSVRSFPFVD